MEPYGDNVKDAIAFLEADLTDAASKPFAQHSLADALIKAEALLPNNDGTALACVVKYVVGPDGKLIGEYNDNPLLNSLFYECKFDDSTVKEYAANTIASNIFIQSDEDGFSVSILYHIVDHKSSEEAVKMADKYFCTSNGTKCMRQMAQGWKFLVKWSNGSRQRIDLNLLKESNPVQAAEYATSCNIAEEPAFAWWFPYLLRKQDAIVKAVNSCVCCTSHKYGIELPTSVNHAIDIDCKNKNIFWQDALKKEMGNVWIAFKILGPNKKAPPGWHKASRHIVFYVKMDFTRKARWVKGGHKTSDSLTSSFAGIVSSNSIHISLTHAALLGLPVLGANIRNAYL